MMFKLVNVYRHTYIYHITQKIDSGKIVKLFLPQQKFVNEGTPTQFVKILCDLLVSLSLLNLCTNCIVCNC